MAAAILGLTAGTAVAQLPIFVSNQTLRKATRCMSLSIWADMWPISTARRMYDTLVNEQSGRAYWARPMSCARCRAEEHPRRSLETLYQRLGGDPNDIASWTFPRASSTTSPACSAATPVLRLQPAGQIPTFRPASRFLSVRRNADRFLRVAAGNESPFLNNSVRRMTHKPYTASAVQGDLPRRLLAERLRGSEPVAQRISGCRLLRPALQEYQRNSTDDWTGSVEWKPVSRTR